MSVGSSKQFFPKEILVYVRLLKYALKALDIYTICVNPNGGLYVRSPRYVTLNGFGWTVVGHLPYILRLWNNHHFRSKSFGPLNNPWDGCCD